MTTLIDVNMLYVIYDSHVKSSDQKKKHTFLDGCMSGLLLQFFFFFHTATYAHSAKHI